MKNLFFALFVLLLGATTAEAQENTVNYGDVIHLQNGWNNYRGGYLDTRGYQKDYAKTGNFLCVSTATKSNRDGGSGLWKVMSATGKANGSPVLVNDNVYLQNQWNRNGGYLDTRGYQKDYAKTGNHLCVSTAKASNRADGSGTWKVISATGSRAGTPITNNSEIQLQNGWNKFQGGYLDTRGYQKDYAKTGNLLCVSTATSPKRDGKSGTWKVVKVKKEGFDSNAYYRLTSKWQGEGKSLDILNDGKNNQPILAKTGDYTGQAWKITKVGADIYTLTTKWQGPTKKLDCIQGANQNRPVLNVTEKSGSAWKLIPLGNGYYRITNMWLSDRSLDIVNDGKNNKIQVAKTGDYSGQAWKITKIK